MTDILTLIDNAVTRESSRWEPTAHHEAHPKPWFPVVMYFRKTPGFEHFRLVGRRYLTKVAAVAEAERAIDRLRGELRRDLLLPENRELRKMYQLPEEI